MVHPISVSWNGFPLLKNVLHHLLFLRQYNIKFENIKPCLSPMNTIALMMLKPALPIVVRLC